MEIQVLRAGPAPYPWRVPGRVASSFITETPETLTLVAQARVKGRPDLAGAIRWRVDPPAGFELEPGADLQGPKLSVRLRRPGGNPSGGGEPLALAARATLSTGGRSLADTAALQQDARDRLRQEYVDLERAFVPGRGALLDADQFARLYGKKYPSVEFAELNWSKIPGSEERYPVILASEELVRTLHRMEALYGRSVVLCSGFRNPVRQVQVHASVEESHHQYGRAADLYVPAVTSRPGIPEKIASEADWLRLAAAAQRAGGSWIEPMLACHVNTAGCHVHLDVREAGARTSLVRVTGQVTDATGQPVPNATVRLAGMPGATNQSGSFALKHVLVPREYELVVEAPGIAPFRQPISVTENTSLAVRLPGVVARQPLLPLPPRTPRAAEFVSRVYGAPGVEAQKPKKRSTPRSPLPAPTTADAGAAAGGLAAGGVVAAVAALARRKGRKPAPPAPTCAPSVDPSALPPARPE